MAYPSVGPHRDFVVTAANLILASVDRPAYIGSVMNVKDPINSRYYNLMEDSG